MADRARCTVLLGSAFCTLVAASATADLTPQQEQAALTGHNEIRSDVASGLVGDEPTARDMVKLDGDDDLALVIQSWLDQCIWDHNPNRTSQYGALVGGNTYVGENLAVYLTTGSPPNLVDFALDMWFDEVADYTYGPFDNADFEAAGHYTQLAWADTQRVGCGLAVCPGSAFGYPNSYTAYYFGCDYAQGGNYLGEYPYEAGPTASHCPPGYPYVENGLCVMPEPGELAMLGSGALLLAGLRRRTRFGRG
jgi:cysteine-rich secretory family protein